MPLAFSGYIIAVVVKFAVYLPTPLDVHGWGLRVHNLTIGSPYLVGESISQARFDVILFNFSKEPQSHDPLIVARDNRDLRLSIVQPDGKQLGTWGERGKERDPFTQKHTLRMGEFTSLDFRFADFGYHRLLQSGRFRLELMIRIDGQKIIAPSIKIDVVEFQADAVLISHTTPLVGREAMLPVVQQCQPLVQQVKVGNRTLLVYRRCYDPKSGGGVYLTARLAELPGKVEMHVEGAYGDGKPLTITYQDAKSPTGKTTLVINSVDGTPWTIADENALRAREKPSALQPAKP